MFRLAARSSVLQIPRRGIHRTSTSRQPVAAPAVFRPYKRPARQPAEDRSDRITTRIRSVSVPPMRRVTGRTRRMAIP